MRIRWAKLRGMALLLLGAPAFAENDTTFTSGPGPSSTRLEVALHFTCEPDELLDAAAARQEFKLELEAQGFELDTLRPDFTVELPSCKPWDDTAPLSITINREREIFRSQPSGISIEVDLTGVVPEERARTLSIAVSETLHFLARSQTVPDSRLKTAPLASQAPPYPETALDLLLERPISPRPTLDAHLIVSVRAAVGVFAGGGVSGTWPLTPHLRARWALDYEGASVPTAYGTARLDLLVPSFALELTLPSAPNFAIGPVGTLPFLLARGQSALFGVNESHHFDWGASLGGRASAQASIGPKGLLTLGIEAGLLLRGQEFVTAERSLFVLGVAYARAEFGAGLRF